MHGMPISSVAPRGDSARSFSDRPTADRSVIVSDEFLRVNEPLTVLTLAVLGCLECDDDFGLVFTVAFRSVIDDLDDRSPFGGTGGGMVLADFRDVVLLVAVAVDMVDATDERADEVESDLLGAMGESLLLSAGDDGARLPFAFVLADIAEILDAAEDTLTLGDEVAAVRALVVDTLDTTLERAAVLGVMSDLAVSKLVELSLVVDMVEFGRERPEGECKLEGLAAVFRTVEALETVDFADAADDRNRAGTSFVDAVADACLRGVGVCLGVALGIEAVSREERAELAMEEPAPGVSLESGRGPAILIILRVAVDVRETVECVLRATDLAEAADVLATSPAIRVTLRFEGGDLSEYMLWLSSSIVSLEPPRGLPVGVAGGPLGLRSSSCLTSISMGEVVNIVQAGHDE